MARPRRGKRRRQSRDWLRDYLITGIEPEPQDPEVNPFDVLSLCSVYSEGLREAWKRSGIMDRWNQPGQRPFGWWAFDAPRLPVGTFPDCYFDGKLPEPRRHLGGPGQPLHERLAFVPTQHFGIWAWFGDPANPPGFETQFDYLTRHGLLLPGEDAPLTETHTRPDHIVDAGKWEASRNDRAA